MEIFNACFILIFLGWILGLLPGDLASDYFVKLLSFFPYFLLFVILSIVSSILIIFGMFHCFKKAHIEEWKAIIPILNIYSICQLTGITPVWLILIFCVNFISNLFSTVGILIDSIFSLCFSLILNISFAKSFGKGVGVGIGLTFLPSIFYLYLGCGSAKYIGPHPVNDFLTNKFDSNKANK